MYQTERLELQQDLVGFSNFLSSLSGMDASYGTMSTAYEMLLDAIYLSVQNITSLLPTSILNFQWSGPAGSYPNDVVESSPPLQNFKVSWRPAADRIIIVFSDEHPQSYLFPQLSQEDVKTAVSGAPQLKLYTFTNSLAFG